jgi:exodeoxyribonuclease VII large subunit
MTSWEEIQFDDRRVYSLSEVAESLKEAIQVNFPDAYWIKAEIAKLNYYYKSGHCYLDLVDRQDKVVRAEMRATIWAGTFQMISGKFRQVTREDLHDGMMILFMATINFHELYGLSLNIIDIEPSFTLGEMARDKRDTIEKLKREGLFDKNKQLTLPLVPKRLAIISVETSKGYNDLISTLDSNPYGYTFSRKLFPAILQGDKAISTITGQLKLIGSDAGAYDVVLIIRGGGGEVGLSAYDSFLLTGEVAHCPLPVITGIGHSTNETVAEMVAHTNMITPTAVANFLIQKFREFDLQVDALRGRLINLVGEQLEKRKWKLDRLTQDYKSCVVRMLQRNENEIAGFGSMIRVYVKQLISSNDKSLDGFGKRLVLLDPVNVLKRGYSITYYGHHALTDSDQVGTGSALETRLYKGIIKSTVTKTEN